MTVSHWRRLPGPSVSPSPQIRRWFRGKSLPSRNRPWDPPAGAGAPPEPILRLRDRKQWLLVDRLDASRIHPHVAEKIEYALMHEEGVLAIE